jgi:NADH-quinone oxidoreductase subunit H
VIEDPLFADGVDWVDVVIIAGKVVAVFALLLVSVLFYIWFMRKVIADMQARIGPQKAGPFGILQSLADGTKLFFKEQSIPEGADKRIFLLSPYLAAIPAFLSFCVIPIGGELTIASRDTFFQVAELPIGVLFVLAMSGLGVYGVMLAGWSSGSKYPLLGSVRASAQVISYEAALGMSIIGAVMAAGTLSTRGIVLDQAWDGTDSILDWLIVAAPVSFVIFIIAAVAEINHPPFDLVEAEQELVGGFHTEYTGIRFAIFFLAEFMNVVTMSAVAVTLFLGGPNGPEIDTFPHIWPFVWFLLKLLALLWATVWLRASLPRLRYDQLMDLGWRVLIPISFLWLGVMAIIQVSPDQGWNKWVSVPIAVVVAFVVMGYLLLAMPKRSVASLGVARDGDEPAHGPDVPAAAAEPAEVH